MSTVLIFLVCLAAAIGLEFGLRIGLGLGKPLIYVADQQIGYLLSPNQQTRRFGNRIAINQYSMRSPDFLLARSSQTLRILLLGDSVANGGWWTDQPDTLSEKMRRSLQPILMPTSFQQVEVLNASAISWSVRNQLAYLQRFGTFAAQLVVVLLNTDDLFGTAPTSIPVGRDRNYPDRLPISALAEVCSRYLLPAPPIPEMAVVLAEPGDRVGFNLLAIEQIQTLVQQEKGQFLLAITPLKREIDSGSRDYELVARQRLQALTQASQIPYLDFLPQFRSMGTARSSTVGTARSSTIASPTINRDISRNIYRDSIHLSAAGTEFVSQRLSEQIQQLLALR